MTDDQIKAAMKMAQRGLRAQQAINRMGYGPSGATWEESLTCPRCGHGIPSDEHRGQYPGALSRLDNQTYVCSDCGTKEAMYQYTVSRRLPAINKPIPL